MEEIITNIVIKQIKKYIGEKFWILLFEIILIGICLFIIISLLLNLFIYIYSKIFNIVSYLFYFIYKKINNKKNQ
jgi:hypothetical protein